MARLLQLVVSAIALCVGAAVVADAQWTRLNGAPYLPTALVTGALSSAFTASAQSLYTQHAKNQIASINPGKSLNFLSINETSDGTLDNYGVVGATVNTNTNGGKFLIVGTTGEASHAGGNDADLSVVGTAGVARFDGTGNALAAMALLASPNLKSSTGAPVSNYGLFVDSQTIGSTANYAIYTNAGWVRFGDLVIVTGGLVNSSPAAGIGYTTGACGTVTQGTSKATGVALNANCGQITMNNAALAAAAEATFTVTDTAVQTNDVVFVCVDSGGTAGAYSVWVSGVGAGTFDITVSNVTGGSLSEAPVISFMVFKSATA